MVERIAIVTIVEGGPAAFRIQFGASGSPAVGRHMNPLAQLQCFTCDKLLSS